jgi:hypothetical protein
VANPRLLPTLPGSSPTAHADFARYTKSRFDVAGNPTPITLTKVCIFPSRILANGLRYNCTAFLPDIAVTGMRGATPHVDYFPESGVLSDLDPARFLLGSRRSYTLLGSASPMHEGSQQYQASRLTSRFLIFGGITKVTCNHSSRFPIIPNFC